MQVVSWFWIKICHIKVRDAAEVWISQLHVFLTTHLKLLLAFTWVLIWNFVKIFGFKWLNLPQLFLISMQNFPQNILIFFYIRYIWEYIWSFFKSNNISSKVNNRNKRYGRKNNRYISNVNVYNVGSSNDNE